MSEFNLFFIIEFDFFLYLLYDLTILYAYN